MTRLVKWKDVVAVANANAGRAGYGLFAGESPRYLFARAGRPCALPVFTVSN